MDRDEFARRLLSELGYDGAKLDAPVEPIVSPTPPQKSDPTIRILGGVLLLVAAVLAAAYLSKRSVSPPPAQATEPRVEPLARAVELQPAPATATATAPAPAPESEPEREKPSIERHRRAQLREPRQQRQPQTQTQPPQPQDPRARALRAILAELKAEPNDGEQLARLREQIVAWAKEQSDPEARATIIRRATSSALASDLGGLEACIAELERRSSR